ncbi:uncharacterized protein EI90DRAFT_3033792 [Cantharellus anzutake]|uniref:uncharacterized protein n=1 Tax=Cantharellus anzutake TaxID=1750568 RepID=UPI001905E7BF|nr:uncharacterized protein EI90DRAFT_3033792 [Cantharellus anzutake]KAF8341387.1 hypothetical protein EI90DRAFT_3033792 [Cantharellus anzutake]
MRSRYSSVPKTPPLQTRVIHNVSNPRYTFIALAEIASQLNHSYRAETSSASISQRHFHPSHLDCAVKCPRITDGIKSRTPSLSAVHRWILSSPTEHGFLCHHPQAAALHTSARRFASVALRSPTSRTIDANMPQKESPDSPPSKEVLFRQLEMAKLKGSRRSLVALFEQIVHEGWLNELPSETILFCAESMRYIRHPHLLTGKQGILLVQQTARALEPILDTLRQRTYHSDDILLRIQSLECHHTALTGNVTKIGTLTRRLFLAAAPTGTLDDPGIADLLFRTLIQSICAYKRNNHSDSAKGALFCVLQSWTVMRPYLFSQQRKAYTEKLYLLGNVIRKELFDVLTRCIERPGEWYQSRQALHTEQTFQHLGELLIECYGTREMPLHALSVLRSMQQIGVPVVHYSMMSVLKLLISHDLLEIADEVYAGFRDLMKADLSSEAFLHASLQYFAHKGDCESVEDIREEMINRGYSLNAPRMLWIMHVYAVAGNPDRVIEYFESFFPSCPQTDSNPQAVRPSVMHFATVIYAQSLVGGVHEMNAWLEKMVEADVSPDIRVFNHILKAFSHKEDLDAVEETTKRMRASGVRPNQVTYSLLMRMYGRRRDPINAENVFHQCLKAGLRPNQQLVLALMDAHADAGSWKGVIRVFDFLRAEHSSQLWLDVHIYNVLLKAYVLVGSPFPIVLHLMESFEINGIKPNPTTYLLAVQAACNAGKMDAARDLLAEMLSLGNQWRGSDRSALCFAHTMMMGTYLRLGDKGGAKEIYSAMQKQNIVPTSTTFGIIIRAYGNEGTLEGLRLAEEFLAALLRLDPEQKDPIWTRDPRGRTHALEDVFVPILQANNRWHNLNHVEHHFATLSEMEPGPPTILALCPLMESYSRAGDLDGVKAVWERIFETALWETRTREILHSHVGAQDKPGASLTAAREGALDGSQDELRKAGQRAQRSNILCVPLSTYISALSGAGKHNEVAHVWAKVKAHGFGFDSHNWNHLAICLVRAGEPERAFEILEKVILPFQEFTARDVAQRELKPETPFTFVEASSDWRDPGDAGKSFDPLLDHTRRDTLSQHADDLDLGRAGPAKRPYHFIQESDYYYPVASLKHISQGELGVNADSAAGDAADDDLAEGLHLYHQISPAWNHWKPHRITLHVLDAVLKRLASGRMIRPANPSDSLQLAVHEEQSVRNAEELHRRIIERFPAAVKAVYDVRYRHKRDIRKGISQKGYMNPMMN